jgi:hypothetical protein
MDREGGSVVIYSKPDHVPRCCSRSSCQPQARSPAQVDSRSDAIDQGLFVQKGHRQQLLSGSSSVKVEHIGAASTKPAQKIQLADKSGTFEMAHDPVLPSDHQQAAVWGNAAPELTVPR